MTVVMAAPDACRTRQFILHLHRPLTMAAMVCVRRITASCGPSSNRQDCSAV